MEPKPIVLHATAFNSSAPYAADDANASATSAISARRLTPTGYALTAISCLNDCLQLASVVD